MMKKMMGFTLAEVLTTLMVIGVVAAMTIPTLMNSTNDQQLKVAYKKAMSVLGQGVQLMTAKEVECSVSDDNELATCFANNVLSGTVVGPDGKVNNTPAKNNVVATSDGMAYAFYYRGAAQTKPTDKRSLEDICGIFSTETGTNNVGNDASAYAGKTANCFVIVDVNGTNKGAKTFPKDGSKTNTLETAGVGSSYSAGDDQQGIILTANGVRPLYSSDRHKGYTWMFGTDAKPFSDNAQ